MTLILTTFRYFLSWLRMNYYGGMAQFCYRTSFAAAALTYGIVVYKSQRASSKTGDKRSKGLIGFYSDENVLYLCKPRLSQTIDAQITDQSSRLQSLPLSGSSLRSTRWLSCPTASTLSSTSPPTPAIP